MSTFKLFVILHRTVSTPFLYLPRTRPSVPTPAPLVATALNSGFVEMPQWKLFSSTIAANRREMRDVVAKVRLSASFFTRSDNVVLVIHPLDTNILRLSAHSILPIVPFRCRFPTWLFATRSCGRSNCSEKTGHTDSAHATDIGRCSVSSGQ